MLEAKITSIKDDVEKLAVPDIDAFLNLIDAKAARTKKKLAELEK